MVETILPYRREGIPQTTGYSCGPASARIALSARGIHVPEAELMRQIGTHTGGTDVINWITDRALRVRMPEADYQSVWMPQDPPTQPQRDALWEHITRSVGSGYALVINWVAPPSNYPKGIKGSQSPAYGPGTIYHYVAICGVDTAGEGAVWVVDPGFRPFEFWVSRRQNESLCPPKGYAHAAASSAVAPAPVPPVRPATPSLDVLIKAMAQTTLTRDRFSELLPGAMQALARCDCTTVARIAMWCSQIGHESAGLRYWTELASGEAYNGRTDLGNTQPGDGPRFRGRGPIQLTGRSNYTAVSRWSHQLGYIPTELWLVENPEQLATPEYGWLGTIWYWTVARPQINSMADRRDLEGVTRAINGGLNGLADRRERYNRCLALGDELLALAAPVEAEAEFMTALNPQEQRNLYTWVQALAEARHVSISPFRHADEQGNKAAAVTSTERLGFVDGNLHVVMTMMLAAMGDHEHIALLREVAAMASDPARYPDRQAHAALAREVLTWVEETGRPETAPPPKPPFVCLSTSTNQCAAGSVDGCQLLGGAARCIMAELASLQTTGAV